MRRRSEGWGIDMVLSFHPNIVADRNILCAGRLPNDDDKAAVMDASAVILPQGPSEPLYQLCREHCAHVFPDYRARFDYPGKLGQARLFKEVQAPFPATHGFQTVAEFRKTHGQNCPLSFPCIFKSDWGGEGLEVFLIDDLSTLHRYLDRAEKLEQTGQRGFILQELIHHGGRNLRVVIIGEKLFHYWRCRPGSTDPLVNLRTGAVIDHQSDPHLQEAGKKVVREVCEATGINLAGFDLLFPTDAKKATPLFLEINYFFGRKGLGGSDSYYQLFETAVSEWLGSIGLEI